jgi:hypothetical protein
MIYHPETNYLDFYIEQDSLVLIPVKKSHPLFVKWYIEHYPGSKGIPGRQLDYLIYLGHLPIGIIAFASPPRNYKLFRRYFGVDDDMNFLNNNVFRIVFSKRNLGTMVLSAVRAMLPSAYKEKYGSDLKGLITFVEPPRTGSLYKADNWEYLGLTQGIEVRRGGKDWQNKTYTKGVRKHIFGYKFAGKVSSTIRQLPVGRADVTSATRSTLRYSVPGVR